MQLSRERSSPGRRHSSGVFGYIARMTARAKVSRYGGKLHLTGDADRDHVALACRAWMP